MTLRLSRSFALVAMAIIVAVAPVMAKGATVRLAVSGGHLAQTIVLTDEALLSASNVYAGPFLGDVVTEPNPAWTRYAVSFVVESPAWMREAPRERYTVLYASDPVTGRGFIYLPGRGESGFRLNRSTIGRDDHDGRWHQASHAWATAMNRHLR